MPRKAIGRGLSALINEKSDNVVYIQIDRIKPNPFQPRKYPSEEIEEMAKSIEEHGVIQPLIVTRRGDDFVLVAGERRLRGAEKAGLTRVPCILISVDDKEMLEIALVENLQRKDLNPVEEAEAYHILSTEFHLTHDQIAKRVGKDRSTITNSLRLLRLPLYVRELLRKGIISQGHARALLSLKDPGEMEKIARIVVKENWTVRKLENYIYKRKERKEKEKSLYITALTERLEEQLDTKVEIKGETRGKIIIYFYNQDELERIVARISRE